VYLSVQYEAADFSSDVQNAISFESLSTLPIRFGKVDLLRIKTISAGRTRKEFLTNI
jgi:hypothetical protein